MVAIHPETLKTLRKRSGLSQAALADRTPGQKVGVATIKRIEAADGAYETRPRIAEGLAKALDVCVKDLSGEPRGNRAAERILRYLGYRQVKPLLDSDTALSYDMVEHLYGVPAEGQIAIAPLLFALMAEGSLAWRREQLAAIDEAAEKLASLGGSAGHLSFAYAGSAERGCSVERDSIEQRDLFGRHVSDEAYERGYDPNTHNPFVDYLRAFAERVKSDDVLIGDDIHLYEVPKYRVGERVVEELTGDDRLAHYAMSRGHSKIKDIPEDLLGKDRREERIAWMVSCVPAKEREEFEKQEREFEALRKKVGIDLSETTGDAPSPESC